MIPLYEYLNGISREPVFKVMQCEGREWVKLFSREAVARFDYIFTDAMTWTDHKGRRMRLWIPEETFIDNDQQFMNMLVEKIEAILSKEPVDIYVNPTFLPQPLMSRYDELWTPERMDRVIKVLKDNDVALEINARYKIPSISFIKRAKAAGVKFTFGTNNTTNNDLGRLEYCLRAIKEAGLTKEDVFLPRSSKDKKVMKMGLPAKITG
jgi:histidinol phosphatase-like PHP family hydrolase